MKEGIVFLPIDVYFFTMLSVSILLAYIFGTILYSKLISKTIKGRMALVTGAALGIGREIAFHLAAEGCSLILWDINEVQLQNTENEIKEKYANRNINVYSYRCDVSSYEDVHRVSQKMNDEILSKNNQYIEILINNAGVVSGKPFEELTERDILRTFGVNTIAHFWTLKEFLPEMKRRNRGNIVTIASTCGILSATSLSDYCASKFAVIGFHDCIRLELRKEKKSGVHMSLICPNTTNTGMFDGVEQGLQWLFPVLTPKYVASSVINAIKLNQSTVFLPKRIKLGMLIVPSLPNVIKDFVLDFAGASSAMDGFKGRK